MTLLAGLVPAWRATRVAPVEALRDAATTGKRPRLPARAVRRLVSIVGAPGRPHRRPRRVLARRNAMRAPGRTMITASALTIGVALVCAVAVLAAGLRDSTRGNLEKRVTAGFVLTGQDGWEPTDSAAGKAIAATPGVRTVSAIRQDAVKAFGQTEGLNAVDPATIGKVADLKWKQGSKATLPRWRRRRRARQRLRQGAQARRRRRVPHHHAGRPDAAPDRARHRGLARRRRAGPRAITIGNAAYKAGGFAGRNVHLTFIDAPGASAATLQRSVSGFPGAKVFTKSAYVDKQTNSVNQLLGIFYALLALAVIVSLFGLANTLVLATFERTREIGMFRAVGMSRRQLRRMVRRESIITALLGVTVGIVIGLGLAEAVVAKWGNYGFTFAAPIGTLVALAIVACIAGTLAAVLLARAPGDDVLGALA